MIKQLTYRGCILLMALTLSACHLWVPKSAQPSLTYLSWEAHQDKLHQLNQYQASGSFAYIHPERRVSAKFYWQQYKTDSYRLLLTTPFGGKIVELTTVGNFVQISDDENNVYTGNDVQDLVYRLTQMDIPFDDLRVLLIGLPGNATNLQFNEQNQLKLARLRQGNNEWEVDYNSYHNELELPLPSYIQLSQGEQKIKINIVRWTL